MKIKFEHYKDKLNKIYNEFDNNISHYDKIKCIKGCSICCRNVCIMIYPVEAAYIARKLRKFKNMSTLEIIKNRITKAKEIFDAILGTAPITFINNISESNAYFDKIDIVNGLHPSIWTKHVRVTDRNTLTPYREKGACHEAKKIHKRVQASSY